jgi:uncharacterized protein
VKSSLAVACLAAVLCACTSSRPADQFYVLSALPPGPGEARPTTATLVAVKVTLPSSVDRSEMILNTSADAVVIMEHQRWAAPLSELMTQALAQDIERRRGDLLVSARSIERTGNPVVRVNADVTQMSVRRGDRASVEAHWRIADPRVGTEQVGSAVFSAAVGQDDYAAVARALSECVALLADRLAGQIP